MKLRRDGHKWICSMISAHQNMPQISVNYFCVENNYFILALCNFLGNLGNSAVINFVGQELQC